MANTLRRLFIMAASLPTWDSYFFIFQGNDSTKFTAPRRQERKEKYLRPNLACPATRLRTCFASSRELSFFRFCNSNFKYLSLGLLHQSGLLGNFLHGSMLLAYFSHELLRRHVILDHAQSSELRGNRRVPRRLFDSRH